MKKLFLYMFLFSNLISCKKSGSLYLYHVVIYIAGDNDLKDYANFTINKISNLIGSKSHRVKISIFYDGIRGDKNRASEGMIFEVGENGLHLVKNLGNVNSGHIDTFKAFIDQYAYCDASSIADKNILIFWGHSSFHLNTTTSDIRLLNDKTSNSTFSKDDIVEAVRYFSGKIGKKIDLLGLDSCSMMFVEFGYLFKDYVKYLAGSQDQQNAFSWNYPKVLDSINEFPHISIIDFIDIFVKSFEFFYKWDIHSYPVQSNPDSNYAIRHNDTISIINLEKLESFKTVFILLIRKLSADQHITNNLKSDINLEVIEPSKVSAWIDLLTFLEHLDITLTKNSIHTYKEDIVKVKNILLNSNINESVIISSYSKKIYKAKGLSIRFIQNTTAPTFDFDSSNEWRNFLLKIKN